MLRIGQKMQVKASEHLAGLRVKVVARSRTTGGVTVEVIQKDARYPAYGEGARINYAEYNLEPIGVAQPERGTENSSAPKWSKGSEGRVLKRLRLGDVLERFENYAAFVSDGQKVDRRLVSSMVAEGYIFDAKPNIGASFLLNPQAFQTKEAALAQQKKRAEIPLNAGPTDELLNCPHCGKPAVVQELQSRSFPFFVECLFCRARTAFFAMRGLAVAAWNKRVQEAK